MDPSTSYNFDASRDKNYCDQLAEPTDEIFKPCDYDLEDDLNLPNNTSSSSLGNDHFAKMQLLWQSETNDHDLGDISPSIPTLPTASRPLSTSSSTASSGSSLPNSPNSIGKSFKVIKKVLNDS